LCIANYSTAFKALFSASGSLATTALYNSIYLLTYLLTYLFTYKAEYSYQYETKYFVLKCEHNEALIGHRCSMSDAPFNHARNEVFRIVSANAIGDRREDLVHSFVPRIDVEDVTIISALSLVGRAGTCSRFTEAAMEPTTSLRDRCRRL